MTGITLTRGDKRRINSMSISLRLLDEKRQPTMRLSRMHLRMASGRDEIKQSVHSVVPETRVTLDTRLFSQNVIVLAFEVTNDLLESEGNGIRTM